MDFPLAKHFGRSIIGISKLGCGAKMNPKLQNQIARSKERALAAFFSKKAEIDVMLTGLQALSDDHFDYAPEDVTWADGLLTRITDSAFREGEYTG
jgi:hypothetical protein